MVTERGNITINSVDINRIVKEYYEQVHACKFDNLDEMGYFYE